MTDQDKAFIFASGAIGQGAIGEGGTLISRRETSSGDYGVLKTTYRAGLYAEQVKIGFKDKTRQLLLGEGVNLLDIDRKVSEYLPSFNITELKVYRAIQRFIDEQYKPGEDLLISFSPQDFFSYCGLHKNSKGTYSGKQKEEYLEALRGLSKKDQRIIQQQSYYEEGKRGKVKKKYKTYILTAPLLTLLKGETIESDTLEEAQEVLDKARSGQPLPQKTRQTRYVVKPDPIMYALLDKFYVLKSISQYEEIKALHPGDKPKDSTILFLDFIQMLDFSPLKIGRETLAERIGLEPYLRQRKRSLVNSRINEALGDAQARSYILSWREESTGLLWIHLNPDRCSRYAEKLARTKKQEEAV